MKRISAYITKPKTTAFFVKVAILTLCVTAWFVAEAYLARGYFAVGGEYAPIVVYCVLLALCKSENAGES